MKSVDIHSCVEVLHDILKKQMLALFAVLNVSGALDSQINQRQSVLFAFLVNLQIKKSHALKTRNFCPAKAIAELLDELLLSREHNLIVRSGTNKFR